MVSSSPAVTRRSSLGEKASALIPSRNQARSLSGSVQTRTAPSSPPVATSLPSGETDAARFPAAVEFPEAEDGIATAGDQPTPVGGEGKRADVRGVRLGQLEQQLVPGRVEELDGARRGPQRQGLAIGGEGHPPDGSRG